MRKLLTRILISLYVFMLAGFGTAQAHTMSDCDCEILLQILDGHQATASQSLFDCNPTKYKSTLTQGQKQNDKIDPTDNEEEEENLSVSKKISQKKYTEIASNYFTVAFISHKTDYQYKQVKKDIYNQIRFFYHVPSRYILFRVIRL